MAIALTLANRRRDKSAGSARSGAGETAIFACRYRFLSLSEWAHADICRALILAHAPFAPPSSRHFVRTLAGRQTARFAAS
eukprot:1020879-Pleurochrysis_carterae.AAC.1